MPLAIGTSVSLENDGEGWFPLAPSSIIRGSIVAVVPSTEPFYVVQLDTPLEVHEPSSETPAGLRPHRYEHAIVNSRWPGFALGPESRVSVHVRLVPVDTMIPSNAKECAAMPVRISAACHVNALRA
jgi:hypothetical protein